MDEHLNLFLAFGRELDEKLLSYLLLLNHQQAADTVALNVLLKLEVCQKISHNFSFGADQCATILLRSICLQPSMLSFKCSSNHSQDGMENEKGPLQHLSYPLSFPEYPACFDLISPYFPYGKYGQTSMSEIKSVTGSLSQAASLTTFLIIHPDCVNLFLHSFFSSCPFLSSASSIVYQVSSFDLLYSSKMFVCFLLPFSNFLLVSCLTCFLSDHSDLLSAIDSQIFSRERGMTCGLELNSRRSIPPISGIQISILLCDSMASIKKVWRFTEGTMDPSMSPTTGDLMNPEISPSIHNNGGLPVTKNPKSGPHVSKSQTLLGSENH
ncbi:hypothetical protein VP01_1960g2 [Puccinia sorghi]|uniref:Uncharacterized protein n=1 Tax=Puccinia sorghi TaxID=27349 RepID=A0A0L6VDR8_9BASI|nr:hypothetical protein VP01_1960g2 [Puccinia sorghi]